MILTAVSALGQSASAPSQSSGDFQSTSGAQKELTLSQAEAIARSFFSQHPSSRPASSGASSDLVIVWDGSDPFTRSSAGPAFYVFNRGVNDGFVIVSTDPEDLPILGYSYHGSFSAENMPENVRASMLSMRDGSAASGSDAGLRMTGEVDLGTPDYNQDSPYNNKNPYNMPTGCAITATVTVMSYHRWPDAGTGTIPAYRSSAAGRLGPFELGAAYNWDSMDDIATLMLQVGVIVRADYSSEATSARLETVVSELPKYMKYNPRIKYLARYDYPGEWENMLRAEIDSDRPVIYDGYDNSSSGHAFVIDGYNDQGFFNINWGWGGMCNGFYHLDRMFPEYSGIGGNVSGGYSEGQGGIFYFSPRTAEDEKTDDVNFFHSQSFANRLAVLDMNYPVKQGDSFRVDAGLIKNYGTNTIKNDFKLVMTDPQGDVIEEFNSFPAYPLEPYSTQLAMNNQITITITQLVKAGYRLRVVFKSDITGKWVPVTCEPDLGKWEILLQDPDSGVDPEPTPDPTPSQPVDESTSLSYDKATDLVTIMTLKDATVTLKDQLTGADRSDVLVPSSVVGTSVDGVGPRADSVIEKKTLGFKKADLQGGPFVLTVRLGDDVMEVLLKIN